MKHKKTPTLANPGQPDALPAWKRAAIANTARKRRRAADALPALRAALDRAKRKLADIPPGSPPVERGRAVNQRNAAGRALLAATMTAAGRRVPNNLRQCLGRALRAVEAVPGDQAQSPAPVLDFRPIFEARRAAAHARKLARRARFRAADAPQIRKARADKTPPRGPKPYAVRALLALARQAADLAGWIDAHRALDIHHNHQTR